MKTVTVESVPPAELVASVRRLKAHFPYRICWGTYDAFDPNNTEKHLQGADYDKRKFNRALREPNAVGFTL